MFCQLVYLRRCIPARIRRALDELPMTLDETYARSLEEIDEQNWEYAHRLFQCVAAASRPLRVKELAEFLAMDFEFGSTPTLLADWRPEDPAYTVLSVCSSLLAIVELELSDNDHDTEDKNSPVSSVIQFAHFSVKEYLMSARLAKANDTISHFHVSMTAAHTIVAQACLGVLLHINEDVTKDRLEDFPLAEYAAEHWMGHALIENVSSKVQDGMERLFDPNRRHFSVWVWIYDPDSPMRKQHGRVGEARATPLHYAACCGLHDIAAFLIVDHSQDVHARGFDRLETPMHVASRCGHLDIAQLLLDHGADANAQDNYNFTPLHPASRNGHVDVVRVLLDRGVDANARDNYNHTPLHWASNDGHADVARILLDHGADAKAQDNSETSVLHLASGCGYADVVRVLLDFGADTEARSDYKHTPLHWAVKHVDVVRVLLDFGADVEAQAADKRTPLHSASADGHVDVVRVLLEHGADAEARDNKGKTPFMIAAQREYPDSDTMQLLLEYGAVDHRERNLPRR